MWIYRNSEGNYKMHFIFDKRHLEINLHEQKQTKFDIGTRKMLSF